MPDCKLASTGWTIDQWQAVPAAQRVGLLRQLQQQLDPADPLWISVCSRPMLEEALAASDPQAPLYAIPFAVKDNIDAAGWLTTAACPEFAYPAEVDAAAVAALRRAGAILVGKTNMDQFATGLVGTRSPYGAVANPFSPEHISGGSSSGSAVAVSRGLVPLALGTDTAGSGRVPAGCCNIVGLKPSLGRISTRGVVPACRSLDCVSIFALCLGDAHLALSLLEGYDQDDPLSRQPSGQTTAAPRRLGIPAETEWFGDQQAAAAWERSLDDWQQCGVELVPISFAAMRELALLLYEGPWVAERHAAIRSFFADHAEAINPVVRGIIGKAAQFSASDAYSAEYQRLALRRRIHQHFAQVDALLVPTAPRLPRQAEVAADPVGVNSQLGTWTNFVNLADCCALALPACFRADGLPFGVTLIAPAGHDTALATLGQRWLAQQTLPLGATDRPFHDYPISINPSATLRLAVVGAHLSGEPLNHQLTSRGARLLGQQQTGPHYRLLVLPTTGPLNPGLVRVKEGGSSIATEVWELSAQAFAEVVALVPAPLCIGRIALADGSEVPGFLCESWAVEEAEDISAHGGWKAWLDQQGGS